MAISANFLLVFQFFVKHNSFKQNFQNLEPENPRIKIKKFCQNEQLKFITSIYNQLNIYAIIVSWLD